MAARIDAHQHFWRYTPEDYAWLGDSMAALRRDFLPDDLFPQMSAAGFDGCVAVQVRQTLDETRWLLELAERYRFIAGVVGWVDLCSPRVAADLAAFGWQPKLVGIRHLVQEEPDDFLMRDDFRRGIGQLRDFGFAYDLLVYSRQLPAAADLVNRFDGQRFVLDHLGKPNVRGGEYEEWEQDLRRIAECPHVWCKLSGLVTEADWNNWTEDQLRPYLDAAFEYFGPDRLMIGSDWPVCTLAGNYARVMGVVADYVEDLGQAERDAVLGGNAIRFWNLSIDAPPRKRVTERAK
jgi:L-fuconolactonase